MPTSTPAAAPCFLPVQSCEAAEGRGFLARRGSARDGFALGSHAGHAGDEDGHVVAGQSGREVDDSPRYYYYRERPYYVQRYYGYYGGPFPRYGYGR